MYYFLCFCHFTSLYHQSFDTKSDACLFFLEVLEGFWHIKNVVVLTQTQTSNMFEVQVWENVLEFGVVVRNLESKIQSICLLNLTLKCWFHFFFTAFPISAVAFYLKWSFLKCLTGNILCLLNVALKKKSEEIKNSKKLQVWSKIQVKLQKSRFKTCYWISFLIFWISARLAIIWANSNKISRYNWKFRSNYIYLFGFYLPYPI